MHALLALVFTKSLLAYSFQIFTYFQNLQRREDGHKGNFMEDHEVHEEGTFKSNEDSSKCNEKERLKEEAWPFESHCWPGQGSKEVEGAPEQLKKIECSDDWR